MRIEHILVVALVLMIIFTVIALAAHKRQNKRIDKIHESLIKGHMEVKNFKFDEEESKSYEKSGN